MTDPSGLDFWDVLDFSGLVVLAGACVVGAIWTGGVTLVALGTTHRHKIAP